jgi:hypothetical protein
MKKIMISKHSHLASNNDDCVSVPWRAYDPNFYYWTPLPQHKC